MRRRRRDRSDEHRTSGDCAARRVDAEPGLAAGDRHRCAGVGFGHGYGGLGVVGAGDPWAVCRTGVVVSTAVAPFVAGTIYYVSATGFAAGTFQLAATPGGTPITASASGPLGYDRGPIWTAVRGLREFKPSLAAALQEDSDFDSGGYKSSTKTAVGWSLETKVARKVTADAVPAYDPGQEKLRLAADQNGPANTVHVRWYKVGAVRTEAYEGYAAAEWAPDGGGMDALDTASVKLTGQGKRQPIAHPYTG